MIWATNGTHELDILIEPPFAVSLAVEHDDKVFLNAYRAIPDHALRAFTTFGEKIARSPRSRGK
jgi:hypothetical protein